MKHLSVILSTITLSLLLTACGTSTVRYAVTFDTQEPLRRADLSAAMQRVIEGRLLAKKKKLITQELTPGAESATLAVTVPDEEAAAFLTEGLTAPFTMEIMKQVKTGEGDFISEKYGEFKESGITTKHFDWVTARPPSTETGAIKGAVILSFTPEGQNLLKDMFARNRGSVIGIFVRGQLMSKKTIDASDNQGSIAIEGIPNAGLAAAFADDVNVGLHTRFIPVP